jgi:methyltransferase (TIGR00027 family)
MRTDGDTWGITTGVGSSALIVAAGRALAGRRPNPLAVDPIAETFLRAAGSNWAALLDGTVPEHPIVAGDSGTGFQEYQAARTRYFDDYVHSALTAGIRQVVILAAGLDSRAYRLAWPQGSIVYELDRPQVLAFKRETLAANNCTPRTERREVAVDLREDWPKALCDSGFDPTRPAAWLVEGLVVYLPPAALDNLFATVHQCSAPGSQVAVEQMDPLPAVEVDAMAAIPETDSHGRSEWLSLIYNNQRSEAAGWFSDHGWTADRVSMIDYLRAHSRPEPTVGPSAGVMSPLVSLVHARIREWPVA